MNECASNVKKTKHNPPTHIQRVGKTVGKSVTGAGSMKLLQLHCIRDPKKMNITPQIESMEVGWEGNPCTWAAFRNGTSNTRHTVCIHHSVPPRLDSLLCIVSSTTKALPSYGFKKIQALSCNCSTISMKLAFSHYLMRILSFYITMM